MEDDLRNRRKERLRRKKERQRRQRMLMLLVCALALVLVVVIAIAVTLGGHDAPAPTDPSGSTGPTVPVTDPPKVLTVVTPDASRVSTMDETVTFMGYSDPKQPLTINGEAVHQDENGMFCYEAPLAYGENGFLVSQGDSSLTYTVTRRYATKSYFPDRDTEFCSEATILFEVAAKTGSQVSVTFRGRVMDLKLCDDQLGSGAGEGFSVYVGKYALPSVDENTDMGPITYTVTCDGVTESFTTDNVVCKKKAPIRDSDPSVTPSGGNYLDVGSGLIVEIVSRTAETFDGRTDDDNSNPLNNYLPKGTVDYCSGTLVSNAKAEQTYRVMRCGRRVYEAKRNYPAEARDQISMVYNGVLPDHNEIGFSSLTESGDFTILTLDAMWKAPFFFDMAPQAYTNPPSRDFTISEFTIEYLDITFCYATKFEGEVQIPENHPLFQSAEVTQNESDCTLRLYLRKKGGFYGWDSYYNENGQLCFKFLKPTPAAPADNAYGANLAGITVFLDVGHGGVDSGTIGHSGGSAYNEAGRNLALAQALRKELESMGATVILNREDNSPITIEERLAQLKEAAPDLCIAIHHNASTYTSANGFEVFYFGPMSQLAAKHILMAHKASDVYSSAAIMWHYYHLARQSNCPIVLTENGYMSNQADMDAMVSASMIEKKAQVLAQGVADYFLALGEK